MDGVILTRNIEPGEFVQPGAVAFTMANLNELTITVYVPEANTEISLGQSATVTVDSFPANPSMRKSSTSQTRPNSPRAMSKPWKVAAVQSLRSN